jgi:hypothetical protein
LCLLGNHDDVVFKRKLKVHGAQAWDKPSQPANPGL